MRRKGFVAVSWSYKPAGMLAIAKGQESQTGNQDTRSTGPLVPRRRQGPAKEHNLIGEEINRNALGICAMGLDIVPGAFWWICGYGVKTSEP